MNDKRKEPDASDHSINDHVTRDSSQGTSQASEDLPSFEFDPWHETARPLFPKESNTETIDLALLLNQDVSTTGSFDIRSEIWTTTFGKVLQALPIPAFLVDPNHHLTHANQACSKISPEYPALLGANFSRLFSESESYEKIHSLLEEVFAARKTRVGEAILEITGRRIWARMTLRSLRIMGDRFALCLIEDLTNERTQLQINEKLRRELERRVEERTATLMKANKRLLKEIDQRKRAEEALRENEGRLMAVLEYLPDLLWMKDRKGVFELVNQTFAVACGRTTPTEVVGNTDLDLWPRDLAEKYRRDDEAVYESRQSRLVDEPIMTKGGMRWFETFRTPLLDDDGEIVGTVGSARDITKRKEAEKALRDSEEKYRNILETIADGYHEVDLSGNLTLVTDSLCEIIGYSREELLRMNYRELTDETNAQSVFRAYDKVYRTGAVNTGFDFSPGLFRKQTNKCIFFLSTI